ncbi:50S ribosomal protein L4 [Candidatus Kaiserbacteria bacterium RIFCSPHIGHO2_01_FULL_53_29]|uniref:Large ribosomal subunit protein uL4 n=1 Tax=Candidatus Kaiserbacteria bacterium RIFCSPHIGHO2_01_FULL_53_29 TaxID=1798480 RepID=A0A1F6CYL5_9BACT|nr:MAG: 50S ribosomal protein L4 [Candidatus Kaiserbacteria bacterium RIFCSPHIGHO2_01_FULL_53_29]
MESVIYNAQGKKQGSVKLPESIFGVAWNDSLMHQVVTGMQANARSMVAHVKNRGEVRGGGKKPWAQKGTGRARHGSTRSPIWKGGGVTHGPRKDKNYSQAIPKKMRAKGLFMALSRKLKDSEIIFVDSFGLNGPKTAAAQKVLAILGGVSGFAKLATKRKNAALIALADPTEAAQKSFRNIGNVTCVAVRNLNPVSVLGNSYLIIENPEAAVAIIAQRVRKPVAKP